MVQRSPSVIVRFNFRRYQKLTLFIIVVQSSVHTVDTEHLHKPFMPS